MSQKIIALTHMPLGVRHTEKQKSITLTQMSLGVRHIEKQNSKKDIVKKDIVKKTTECFVPCKLNDKC